MHRERQDAFAVHGYFPSQQDDLGLLCLLLAVTRNLLLLISLEFLHPAAQHPATPPQIACRLRDLWSRFSGGKDGTIWYYSSLAQIFTKVHPGALAGEFECIVASLWTI